MTTANQSSRGLLAVTLALSALGCSPAPAAKTREPAEAKHAANGIARGTSPLDKLTAPSLAEQTFDGEVREALPAGPYVYLAVTRQDGSEAWVTTLKRTAPEPGARVRVKSFGSRRDFHSKRLGRSFETLSFGIVYPIDENGEVALLSEEETR
jgi:hypothetical protein